MLRKRPGLVAFFNDAYRPESEVVLSAKDRGFLYGDGLFETVRIHRGRPFLWDWHFERFEGGAWFLRIRIPHNSERLCEVGVGLALRNRMPESVLRLALSRGSGERGYSISGSEVPMLVATLHPLPSLEGKPLDRLRLVVSSARVAERDPLCRFKTANKLLSVVAKMAAADAGVDDALILNSEGNVVESSSANVFWVEEKQVFTPPLEDGVLPGVTRRLVFKLCEQHDIPLTEISATPAHLKKVESIFLTSSVQGIAQANQLDGVDLPGSIVVEQIQREYQVELDKWSEEQNSKAMAREA